MSDFKLGKSAYEPDERTIFIAPFVRSDTHVPGGFDFDRHRRPLPLRTWGNCDWQNCVIASQANQLLRFERIEQRQTILLGDSDVISRYRQFTSTVAAGDTRDKGIPVLTAMKNWRTQGWPLETKTGIKNYSIAAYGELEPNDRIGLRSACYTMHGIHLGFWLPTAAKEMTEDGHWFYNGRSGEEWEAGSWGGLLAYAKAYDMDGFEITAWGRKIWVSNQFIEKYVDEAWAVVASFEDWRTVQSIDVESLQEKIEAISKGVKQIKN